MNKIRSLANSPRLDKHENPKRAKVKKNTPEERSTIDLWIERNRQTKSILESRNVITVQSSEDCGAKLSLMLLTRHYGRRAHRLLKI